MKEKKKIIFFVISKGDSFIDDIIMGLAEEYKTKKIIVTDYKQIDEGMEWADICWFEWCDQLVIYGSKLEMAKEKKIICRLHSYESLTNNITQVNWYNVDKLIFVAEHIRNIVLSKVSINKEKTIVISNGIDLDKYKFKEREKGFNIAYVGYINHKKGPMLLFHTFKAIHDKDNRYKLYIAGAFQDERYLLYFHQMIEEMGLKNSVIYQGWQDDINKWLNDKQYIISTSILEGHPIGIMEAMARGLKPIIHNFVGAKGIYPQKYIWNRIDEAVDMVISDDFNSSEYRKFIVDNYSLKKQMNEINNLINHLIITPSKKNQRHNLVGLIENFKKNSDNIINTEILFDYLLQIGDEKAYMSYLSEWFNRSRFDLTSRLNYYYANMYRRFNSYSRFDYIKEEPYKGMEKIGEKFIEKYYDKYFGNEIEKKEKKKKVLFILNGLDYKQVVTKFYLDLIKSSQNENFEYHIVSLLNENEFRNGEKTIQFMKENSMNYFIPNNKKIQDKVEEIYKYISLIMPKYAVFQSFYFAPTSVLIYPLLKKLNIIIGRVVHQQPENYFDRRIDFVSTCLAKYIPLEYKDLLDLSIPIQNHNVDKDLDIRKYLNLNEENKIIISIGREIKYFDIEFWKFIVKVVSEIDNLTFVVFGCDYENFKQYIPEKLIENKKIIFGGFNSEASGYLKSCDIYINSPIPGGSAFSEAYYSGLPIVTFFEEKDKKKFNINEYGYLIPAIYFNEAEKIFPKLNDYNQLFKLTKKLLTDQEFNKYYDAKRRIECQDVKFENYCKKFEQYLIEKGM